MYGRVYLPYLILIQYLPKPALPRYSDNLNTDERRWTQMDTDEDIEEKKYMKRMKFNRSPITNYQLPITYYPFIIFLVLSLNVILAPVVYAATDGTWQRTQAYALGILGFVTLGLVIYLFDVVFRPERY
ncbi:MAG: hypothetical protein N4J56_003043 [Chroococcidiopsis sp. SAG 2025]|uniref:potassium-transporting ATPase subunit F n=1 Tax=Chroococcidiopsis sp. SAG 2025 TaxID=171389 RepID=UPI00293722E4|nr:potassium-transporting ATPase subunit F [Chroococcidiopsis sp. SAG 2025]MDV2993389.1 hypothetical protein [Chroococcidiopsis sp. SAG 2025]